MDKNNMDLHRSIDMLINFMNSNDLTTRISRLETNLIGANSSWVSKIIPQEEIDTDMLRAALEVKKSISQIDVVIHALGIINALPYILEVDEKVEYLSLGAGNTGKNFDVETDRRIAEFKFIKWSGKSDTIRQNTTFKDFFNLAEQKTIKRKYLYILNKEEVLKFFGNNRAIESVLSKDKATRERFFDLYGNKYNTVSQYFHDKRNLVEIVDLKDICPGIF